MFLRLHAGAKLRMEKLRADIKEYETPGPGEDEEECYVPYFVKQHLDSMMELMNDIAEEYNSIYDEIHKDMSSYIK